MHGPAKWSLAISPADDSEQDDHDGDHQKNVDETAHGVGSDKSKKPQDDQNNSNRIDHGYYPFVLLTQAFDRVSSSESCRRRLLREPPHATPSQNALCASAHNKKSDDQSRRFMGIRCSPVVESVTNSTRSGATNVPVVPE